MCQHTVLMEKGTCPDCDEGWAAWRRDCTNDNWEESRRLIARITTFVAAVGPCSAQRIYTELECTDIAMYLALHSLVQVFRLMGPDPYAGGTGGNHDDWIYQTLVIASHPERLATW